MCCCRPHCHGLLSLTGSDKGQSPPPKKRKTSKQKDRDFTNIEAAQVAQRTVSGEPLRRQTAAQQALLQLMCSLIKVTTIAAELPNASLVKRGKEEVHHSSPVKAFR